MLSRSDGRVERGGGTDRHTDAQRGAAALYSRHLCFRLYALLDVMLREHFVISPKGFLEDLLSHITFNEMYILFIICVTK